MRPCPFCGSNDLIVWKSTGGGLQQTVVACVCCNATGPAAANDQEARHAWDQRTGGCGPDLGAGGQAETEFSRREAADPGESLLLALRRKAFAEKEREKLVFPLRFDGLYRSGKNLVAGDGRVYWKYLRFYRSGTVLGCCIAAGPEKCIQWLSRKNESGDLFRGRYTILGSTISFSNISSFGTIDYRGVIGDQVLELEYAGQCGGACGIIDFRFIPVSKQTLHRSGTAASR